MRWLQLLVRKGGRRAWNMERLLQLLLGRVFAFGTFSGNPSPSLPLRVEQL